MDENMELEVKRRLAQYRKCKCLGIAVWIIVAFHFLYLLFKIDSRITWLIGGYGYFILVSEPVSVASTPETDDDYYGWDVKDLVCAVDGLRSIPL